MFDRILLPVDGSEHSKRAALMAAAVASKFGAEVIVFHAVEFKYTGVAAYALETWEEAQDLVDDVVRALKDEGISARPEVHEGAAGRAAPAILDLVKREGVDLIVMGSRGLTDLRGLLVGSTTHKILHLGGCPVLVVR